VGEQNKSSALAIAKSEASTVKQIDQMGLPITTQAKAVDDKFSDVKDRLTRIEGRDVGKTEVVTGNKQNIHLIIAAVAVLLALGSR
jgi:hypothetical protein